MVIHGRWRGRALTISGKPNALTISLEEKPSTAVFSFDGAGRLWTALRAGTSYRRGLNGRVVAKWTTGRDTRDRRWLTNEEARELEAAGRRIALALLEDAANPDILALAHPLDPAAQALLRAAAAMDEHAYAADIRAYHKVYLPVGILPPDQYMAVVLQATEGCSFNTCTFCSFYRDRPFRIRAADSFRQHAEQVKEYLGAGLNLRRTIFLGDANALVAPIPRLLPLLDQVHQVFDVEALGGLFAFLDGFSGERKTAADWAALAERGLERVYIGLESGDPALLRFLRKPGRPEDAVQAVRQMKAGGVSVGVIILLGAGGRQFERAHIERSIAALNAMELDADDLIYFSELVESEGLEYTRAAVQAGITPLTASDRQAQEEIITAGLRFDPARGMPPISRYDIREFVY